MNFTHPDKLPAKISLHIPLGLLSIAAGVFLLSQIQGVERASQTARWQLSNMARQATALTDNQQKFDELLTTREAQVKQAEAIQGQYTSLLEEMLELAKTDEDARKFVEKWQLKRNEAAAEAKPLDPEAPGL